MKFQSKLKIKQNNTTIQYLILILPFFKPYCISVLFEGSMLDMAFDLLKVASIAICVVWMIMLKMKPNNIIKWVVLFEIVMLIAARPEFRMSRIMTLITVVGVFLCIDVMISQNITKLIDSMFTLSTIFLFLNLVFYLVFPQGFNNVAAIDEQVHFLGVSNVLSYSVLLTLLLCFLRDYKLKDFSTKVALILCVMNTLIFRSTTGLIAFSVMLIGYFFSGKQVKWLTFRRAIIIVFILQILFVLIGGQGVFSFFIETILQKQLTFTGRTVIWSEAVELIWANPWFGLGKPTFAVQMWFGRDTYCHNAMLDIALKGGLVSLLAFLIMLFSIEKKVRNEKKYVVEKILAAAVFGFLTIGLMEGLEDRVGFWICLALSSCCHVVERKLENEKK